MSDAIEPITEETSTVSDTLTDYQVAKKLIQLKQSADSRGLVFDLKFKTVKKLLSAKKCFYTGVAFTSDGATIRTIDRVDSNLGYIDSNVVPCTVDINSKKSNLSMADITILYKKINMHNAKKK